MTLVDQLSHRGLVALAGKYGRLLYPPPRLPPCRRGVHAGVRAGGSAGAGRRLLEPPGHHRQRLPHLRPRRPGVREQRRPRARHAQALRHEPLQPPPRRAVDRRARRVRGAGPRRQRAQRPGREPRRAHLQPHRGVIFRAAFSAGDQGLDEFIVILRVFSKILGELHIGDFFHGSAGWPGWASNRRLHAACSALDKFTNDIIDDHMRRGKNPVDADADLMACSLSLAEAKLSKGKDALRFTRDNVKAMIMDMLFGGPETMSSTIEWAMAEMMHSPDTLERLQRELADVVGLDRMVDESDLNMQRGHRMSSGETEKLFQRIP